MEVVTEVFPFLACKYTITGFKFNFPFHVSWNNTLSMPTVFKKTYLILSLIVITKK